MSTRSSPGAGLLPPGSSPLDFGKDVELEDLFLSAEQLREEAGANPLKRAADEAAAAAAAPPLELEGEAAKRLKLAAAEAPPAAQRPWLAPPPPQDGLVLGLGVPVALPPRPSPPPSPPAAGGAGAEAAEDAEAEEEEEHPTRAQWRRRVRRATGATAALLVTLGSSDVRKGGVCPPREWLDALLGRRAAVVGALCGEGAAGAPPAAFQLPCRACAPPSAYRLNGMRPLLVHLAAEAGDALELLRAPGAGGGPFGASMRIGIVRRADNPHAEAALARAAAAAAAAAAAPARRPAPLAAAAPPPQRAAAAAVGPFTEAASDSEGEGGGAGAGEAAPAPAPPRAAAAPPRQPPPPPQQQRAYDHEPAAYYGAGAFGGDVAPDADAAYAEEAAEEEEEEPEVEELDEGEEGGWDAPAAAPPRGTGAFGGDLPPAPPRAREREEEEEEEPPPGPAEAREEQHPTRMPWRRRVDARTGATLELGVTLRADDLKRARIGAPGEWLDAALGRRAAALRVVYSAAGGEEAFKLALSSAGAGGAPGDARLEARALLREFDLAPGDELRFAPRGGHAALALEVVRRADNPRAAAVLSGRRPPAPPAARRAGSAADGRRRAPLPAGAPAPGAPPDGAALRALRALAPDAFVARVAAAAGPAFFAPSFGFAPLDLHRVFWEVQARGGSAAVGAAKRWREVAKTLTDQLSTSASYSLRVAYERALGPLEASLAPPCGAGGGAAAAAAAEAAARRARGAGGGVASEGDDDDDDEDSVSISALSGGGGEGGDEAEGCGGPAVLGGWPAAGEGAKRGAAAAVGEGEGGGGDHGGPPLAAWGA
jgi:hypothetical protein